MTTFNLVIGNTIAQEANYKDIATALGWVEGVSSMTWQEVIQNIFLEKAIEIAALACRNNELLQGRLNYDADAMFELFKSTTTVQFVEVE